MSRDDLSLRGAPQELARVVRERTRRLARTGEQMSPDQAAHVLGMDLAEAVCAGLLPDGARPVPVQALARYWAALGWWTSVLAMVHHLARIHGRWRARPEPAPHGLLLRLEVDLHGRGSTTMVLGPDVEDPPRPVEQQMLRPHLLSAPLKALTCYGRTRLCVPSDLGGVRELSRPGLASVAYEELLGLHALASQPVASAGVRVAGYPRGVRD